jgi:uncharacterized protein YfeS
VLLLLNDLWMISERLWQKKFLGFDIDADGEAMATGLATTSEGWQVVEDQIGRGACLGPIKIYVGQISAVLPSATRTLC